MINSQKWLAGCKDMHVCNPDRHWQLALHRKPNDESYHYMRVPISPSFLTKEGLSKPGSTLSDR